MSRCKPHEGSSCIRMCLACELSRFCVGCMRGKMASQIFFSRFGPEVGISKASRLVGALGYGKYRVCYSLLRNTPVSCIQAAKARGTGTFFKISCFRCRLGQWANGSFGGLGGSGRDSKGSGDRSNGDSNKNDKSRAASRSVRVMSPFLRFSVVGTYHMQQPTLGTN